MSAKDRRKSFAVTLDPVLAAALRAYARDNGDRSLAAACRRALRAELVGAPDRRARHPTAGGRAVRLRLQLEPSLRARLGAGGAPEAAIEALLRRRLGVGFDEG